jgi:hypothetical protein
MFTPQNRCQRPGLVSHIFLTCLLAINISPHGISAGIAGVNDADIREIVSILFEREFPARSDGKEIVVLLDPNFKSTWIPQLKGVRFKQLAYEELKQVAEYYRLNRVEARGKDIKVGLLKGNYCRQAGAVYSFRREKGKWQSKPSGYVETTNPGGTSCVGCQTGSGAVYKVNPRRHPTTAAESVNPKSELKKGPLLLKGKVLAVRCRWRDEKYIECKTDLSLDFSNIGSEPVIILQPHGEYVFWHGGTSLALTRADSEAYIYVYRTSAWPSIYTTPMYSQLAEMLDQPLPSPNVTRVLKPGESWIWKTTVSFSFNEENNCDGDVGVEIGWKEIKKLSTPLWLEVSYEMWPFNVENFKKNLGEKLRERWKTYGALYLEERSGGYGHANLTSEPMELDLREIQLE